MRKRLTGIIGILIIALAPILVLEGALRLFFGYPHGSFNFLLSAKDGLYPRNDTIVMKYGFKPYEVTTNSYGMRGPQIARDKIPGFKRIAALGDSVTDGYFVNNNETYPHLLWDILAREGYEAEVMNVARGGGSVDKELALLKIIEPLKPDVVILTFVNNDVAEIAGKNLKEILNMRFRLLSDRIPEWFFTKTAIGELIGEIKLRMRYKNFRLFSSEEEYLGKDYGELGRRYDENTTLFKGASAKNEGRVLNEPFSPDTEAAIANYLVALKAVRDFCLLHGVDLVFVYFPSYSRVYDTSVTMRMRDILSDECAELSIPFCDLTDAFRKEGRRNVLHFAPYDFHCNAAGNRLIAEEVAKFICERGLVN